MRLTALCMTASLSLMSALGLQAQEAPMEPQFPQQQSAGDLLHACAASRLSGTGRGLRHYCAGFVSGVEEAVRLLRQDGRIEQRVCTPPNLSASALAEVYVKYGANHRGELPEPAAEVVLHALVDAYPCPGRP